MASTITPKIVTDLVFYQGATWRLQPFLSLTDEDDQPIDLTGYSARMEIKKDRSSPAMVVITDEDGLTINGVAGTIDAEMSVDQTMLLVEEKVYWDVYLFAPDDGDVTRIAQGVSDVSPTISTTT